MTDAKLNDPIRLDPKHNAVVARPNPVAPGPFALQRPGAADARP